MVREGGGGKAWCMLRCAGDVQDKTMINRIMLRFRPIAPKPVTAEGSASGHVQIGHGETQLVSKRRTKRKYFRVRKNNRNEGKVGGRLLSLSPSDQSSSDKNDLVTLQLLPERSTDGIIREQFVSCFDRGFGDPRVSEKENRVSMNFNLDDSNYTNDSPVMGLMTTKQDDDGGGDPTLVIESWVTMESVTRVCMDAKDYHHLRNDNSLWITDADRMRRLDADTCPAFVSDGLNRVRWVNGAYKRTVIRDDVGNYGSNCKGDHRLSLAPEIKVWLVVKEELPAVSAFSCRVTVQYTLQKERCLRMVLPCDVWRMDRGGFAWRLDVEAALSLGR